MFVPTLFGQAQPVDTGWNFAPIILIALAAYVWIYVARWRTSRAEGGARAAPYGRLALWLLGIALLFVALISPIDHLGEQFATFHMVQHLILADLVAICLTLALTKHILRPVTRRIHWLERKAGPFGHPGSAWSPTRPRCGSGTSRSSTKPRSTTASSTRSST